MKKKRKIAVITATRATFGYAKRLLHIIDDSAEFELAVVVMGMHLLKDYGYSYKEVEAEGLPIAARVDMVIGGDSPTAFAKSLGVCVASLSQVFDMLKPDIVLVSGDRGEMLAATLTAIYMNIPVAHLQSGDLSGHIDGAARHAITKLCHIHFPACKDSADRVLKMGEQPWRVFDVGAPQLDEAVQGKRLALKDIERALGMTLKRPTALVIQHPVLAEVTKAGWQMRQTLEAVCTTAINALVIYPNVDSGGEEVIKVIREYEGRPNIATFKNIERHVFLNLLRHIDVLIGNSSCGILEAPTFRLPAINIGSRQRGRMQAANVINTGYDAARIAGAIGKALRDTAFRKALSRCVNPYGDGKSSRRVFQILKNIKIDDRLLDKEMTY
ncbi:MAG: UDP-N-acetylglucosamine 2-epimerase [Elusimicrobiota bacterium]